GALRVPADQRAGDEAFDRRSDHDADDAGLDRGVVGSGNERRQSVEDTENAAQHEAEHGFAHEVLLQHLYYASLAGSLRPPEEQQPAHGEVGEDEADRRAIGPRQAE